MLHSTCSECLNRFYRNKILSHSLCFCPLLLPGFPLAIFFPAQDAPDAEDERMIQNSCSWSGKYFISSSSLIRPTDSLPHLPPSLIFIKNPRHNTIHTIYSSTHGKQAHHKRMFPIARHFDCSLLKRALTQYPTPASLHPPNHSE